MQVMEALCRCIHHLTLLFHQIKMRTSHSQMGYSSSRTILRPWEEAKEKREAGRRSMINIIIHFKIGTHSAIKMLITMARRMPMESIMSSLELLAHQSWWQPVENTMYLVTKSVLRSVWLLKSNSVCIKESDNNRLKMIREGNKN